MDTTLKSAHEWIEIKNKGAAPRDIIAVADPDGWRYNDGVTMDTPITLEEFDKRIVECTLFYKRA